MDGLDQVTNAAECSAADSFSCDFREPAFDLVEPGRTGRCEVDVVARSRCKPFLHFGMLVGSIVVENQMDFQLCVNGLVDPIEKPQELLMPMPRLAFTDHGSFQDIQRSE